MLYYLLGQLAMSHEVMLLSYELYITAIAMYLSCICHLSHGYVESQPIWCFYLSKESLFAVEAVISAQRLISIQLGDGMCSGGELFVPIYFSHTLLEL